MDGDRLFYAMVVVVALIGVGLFAIPVRAEQPASAVVQLMTPRSGPAGLAVGPRRGGEPRALRQRADRPPLHQYSPPSRYARSSGGGGGTGLVLGIMY
jgi:hypothetical protein